MSRGVIWLVWGDKIKPLLKRSIDSVLRHHPELEIKIFECDPDKGLFNKPSMYDRSPFDETLYLDADAVVLGDLAYGFRAADIHGIACCIGECPWLRRYGQENQDHIEYNTGVIFFSKHHLRACDVFEHWKHFAPESKGSQWRQGDQVVGLEKDDQWSFSHALERTHSNPHVLPFNWNFRPGFHTRFFTPLKIWHSVHDVPPGLEALGTKTERGEELIQFCTLGNKTEGDVRGNNQNGLAVPG